MDMAAVDISISRALSTLTKKSIASKGWGYTTANKQISIEATCWALIALGQTSDNKKL
jgi:hypothetical protein